MSYLLLRSLSTYLHETTLPKSHRNPARYPGYAHPPNTAVGTAARLRAQQSHPHELRRNPEGGHGLTLSSASSPRAQGLDRRGMEGFRDWSQVARLSLDQKRQYPVAFRALALGKAHRCDCRNHESGREGERIMKFSFWRRTQRNKELVEEMQAHLAVAEREAVESGQSPKDAQAAAHKEFGNVGLTAEVTRDASGWNWLVEVLADIRSRV